MRELSSRKSVTLAVDALGITGGTEAIVPSDCSSNRGAYFMVPMVMVTTGSAEALL